MIDPENLKKMSKDEIIECCSDIANWGFNDYESWEQQSAVYGLLDLYKKQQKEIEEFKKDKNALVNNYSKVLGTFISKDKIREKIKELDSHIWHDGYMTKFDRYAKHYLNELLEENK